MSKTKTKELENILKNNLDNLSSDKIAKKSSKYEHVFCEILGDSFKYEDNPQYDCKWDKFEIELKKAKSSFWIDLSRYTENEPSENSITLFIKYNEDSRVNHIYGIKTKELKNTLFSAHKNQGRKESEGNEKQKKNDELVDKIKYIKNYYNKFSLNIQLSLSEQFFDEIKHLLLFNIQNENKGKKLKKKEI